MPWILEGKNIMNKGKTNLTSKGTFYKIADAFDKLGSIYLKELFESFLNGDISEEDLDIELDDWATRFSSEKDESLSKTPTLVEISNRVFYINSIFYFEKIEKYSYSKNKMEFGILINKSEDSKTTYQNTLLLFGSQEERDKEYRYLKEKLSITGRRFV